MRLVFVALGFVVLGWSVPARADVIFSKPERRAIKQVKKPAHKAQPLVVRSRLRITGEAVANGVTLKIPRHVLRALARQDALRQKRAGAGFLSAPPWVGKAGLALGWGLLALGVLVTLQELWRKRWLRARRPSSAQRAGNGSWLVPAALSLATAVCALAWTTRVQADQAAYQAIGMTHPVKVVLEPPVAAKLDATVRVIAPRRALVRSCVRHSGNK